MPSNRPVRRTRNGILRARRDPDISHGFRAFVPSNAPPGAGFWRIESTGAARTRKGILRVEIPVPENIP